jgi:hypothetical protein
VTGLDGNRPGLHRVRDPTNEVDLEQAVVATSVFYLNVVGQAELALEGVAGNTFEEYSWSLPPDFSPATVSRFCWATILRFSGAKPATASEIRKLSLPVRTMS